MSNIANICKIHLFCIYLSCSNIKFLLFCFVLFYLARELHIWWLVEKNYLCSVCFSYFVTIIFFYYIFLFLLYLLLLGFLLGSDVILWHKHITHHCFCYLISIFWIISLSSASFIIMFSVFCFLFLSKF